MKKLLIFVIALLVLTTAVSAVLTMPGDVLIGSDSERRSNPDADDEDYQEWYVQTTFALQSDVNAVGTQVVFEGVDSKYDATLSKDGTTWSNTLTVDLTANIPVTLYVKAKIPADLDAVDANFAALKAVIGKIKATAGAQIGYSDLKMQAANKLFIDKVKVCVNNGACQTVDNDESVEDLKPGDKLTVEITAENKYSDNSNKEDLDINNVEVSIESADGDLSDIDDSDDLGDIAAKDSDTTTFNIELDKDTDKGDYDVDILVEGDDDNDAKHGEKWTITLKVDRDKHDLAIDDMALEPAQVNCGESATLTVSVLNVGRDDEQDVSVAIRSLALNSLYQKAEYTDLDKDDDDSFVFYIDVPADQTAGQYRIDVQSYYDKTTAGGKDSILLTVACKATEPVQPVESTEFVQPGASVKATLSVPVTFSVKGAAHTLSVSSYDTTTESAVVVLASTPQVVSLAKGVPQRIDLEKDGQDDLVITLQGVSQEGVLTVQVQQITRGTEVPNLVVTGSYTGTAPPTGAVVTEPSVLSGLFEGSGYVVTLVIVDIVILAIAIVLISKALQKR